MRRLSVSIFLHQPAGTRQQYANLRPKRQPAAARVLILLWASDAPVYTNNLTAHDPVFAHVTQNMIRTVHRTRLFLLLVVKVRET